MAKVLSDATVTVIVNGKPVTGQTLSLIDDVTGKPADKVTAKKYAFEMEGTDATHAAFTAFVAAITADDYDSAKGTETRTALGKLFPRAAGSVSGSGSDSAETDKAGTAMREWLKANGFADIKSGGKLPKGAREKWDAHIDSEK